MHTVDFLTKSLGMPYSVITAQLACSTEMVKTFRQFGETLIIVLIANIIRQHHSMSDTRAVVFYNVTRLGLKKLRITKMTTRSPAAIFVRAPTWKASLSRYAINTLSVVPCMTHNVAPVGQSKHVAVSYPLMNWLSERGVFWNSLLLFILCIANYSLVFSFNEHSRNIQMKGFGRKLLSRIRHHRSVYHMSRTVAQSQCRRFKTWGVGQVRLSHIKNFLCLSDET